MPTIHVNAYASYHYILVLGVGFGYLATREVLVFLRIPEVDPGTLYYPVALFPIVDTMPQPGRTFFVELIAHAAR